MFQFFLQHGANASQVLERLKEVNLVAAWQLPPEQFHTLLPLHIVQTTTDVSLLRVRFFEEPIFIHLMLAVGNFGHTLLQNVLPAVLSMSHSSLKHDEPFQTIVLNDCKACGFPNPSENTCMDGIGSYGYTSCESMGSSVYKAMTGYRVKFSRDLFENDTTHLCFRKAVVGFPRNNRFDMLYNPTAEQFGHEKQLVRTRVGALNSYRTSKPNSNINVGVYCKDISRNGRHGNTFRMCEDVIAMLKAMKLAKTLAVRKVNFDGVEFEQQIVDLQDIDLYISDGGSSSYHSHFLRAGAVALSFPLCEQEEGKCYCRHVFTGAYANPFVSHISVKPEHVECHTDSRSDGIFKPLYDPSPSFQNVVSEALELLDEPRVNL